MFRFLSKRFYRLKFNERVIKDRLSSQVGKMITKWFRNKLNKTKNIIITWATEAYIFPFLLSLLNLIIIFSIIYALYENIPFSEAFIYIIATVFTQFPTEPQTLAGQILIIIGLIVGLLFFGYLIAQFSKYLISKITRRYKIRIIKKSKMTDHIVLIGKSSKIIGILKELRSDDLETSSKKSILIVGKKIHDIDVTDPKLKKNVYGLEGEPLDTDVMEKANLEKANTIVILSEDKESVKKAQYLDSYSVMIFSAIKEYLNQSERVDKDIHMLIDFTRSEINLLPCCEEKKASSGVYLVDLDNGKHLCVEPLFLEKLPTYLFVQTIIDKEIANIVDRLISTQQADTDELYFIEIPDHWEENGSKFTQVEWALLRSNSTPIGIIREHDPDKKNGNSGQDKTCSIGHEFQAEVILNPHEDDEGRKDELEKGDKIILITYDENNKKRAREKLEDNDPEDFGPEDGEGEDDKGSEDEKEPKRHKSIFPKNKELYIFDWNEAQMEQILIDILEISYEDHAITENGDENADEIPLKILTRKSKDKDKKLLKEVTERVEEKIDGQKIDDPIKGQIAERLEREEDDMPEFDINKYFEGWQDFEGWQAFEGWEKSYRHFEEPMDIDDLEKVGLTPKITDEEAKDKHIIFLSDEDEDDDHADHRVLYQAQLVENNISKHVTTAVEIRKSENYKYFDYTNIDVRVSINDFSEKLLGQAVLKPYISLVYSDLLKCTPETHEFYIHDVPEEYEDERIIKLQKDLIGQPICFVGAMRKMYLFRLNRSEYKEYLRKGKINPTLRKAFEDNNYSVEEDAYLLKESGRWWVIENKEKKYWIELGDKKLKIYKRPNECDGSEKKWNITINPKYKGEYSPLKYRYYKEKFERFKTGKKEEGVERLKMLDRLRKGDKIVILSDMYCSLDEILGKEKSQT